MILLKKVCRGLCASSLVWLVINIDTTLIMSSIIANVDIGDQSRSVKAIMIAGDISEMIDQPAIKKLNIDNLKNVMAYNASKISYIFTRSILNTDHSKNNNLTYIFENLTKIARTTSQDYIKFNSATSLLSISMRSVVNDHLQIYDQNQLDKHTSISDKTIFKDSSVIPSYILYLNTSDQEQASVSYIYAIDENVKFSAPDNPTQQEQVMPISLSIAPSKPPIKTNPTPDNPTHQYKVIPVQVAKDPIHESVAAPDNPTQQDQVMPISLSIAPSKPPIKTNPTPAASAPDNPTQQSTAAIGAVSIIPTYIPAPIKATYVPPTIDIPINQDQSTPIPNHKDDNQETTILAMMSPPSKSPSNTDPPQEPTTDISGNENIPPDPVNPTSVMPGVDDEGNKENKDPGKITTSDDMPVANFTKKEDNHDMNKPLLILSTLVAYSPNSPAKSAEMANPPKCEHIDKKPKLVDTTTPQTTSITPDSTISGGNSMPSSPEMTDEMGVDGGSRYEEVCLGDCNYFKGANFDGVQRTHYHSSTKNPSSFFAALKTIVDNKEQIKVCNFGGFDVTLGDNSEMIFKSETDNLYEQILIFVDSRDQQVLRYDNTENCIMRSILISENISRFRKNPAAPSTDPFPAIAQTRINEFLKQCLDHIKHLNSPLTNATEDLQQIKPRTCVDLEAEKATHDRVIGIK